MGISITICNLALGDIRADEIGEIGEGGVSAQMCQRYYPHCLDTLLDRHTWSFVTRLVTLAKLSTNERSLEWAYAYGLPTNILRPMRILPAATSTAMMPDWGWGDGPVSDWWSRFEIEANKLYCNLDGAQLEYAADDIETSAMPPLFRDALRKLLASSLAVPIRDSREMKADLLKEAELAISRAIADDMNRQPSGDSVDDIARVRMGW